MHKSRRSGRRAAACSARHRCHTTSSSALSTHANDGDGAVLSSTATAAGEAAGGCLRRRSPQCGSASGSGARANRSGHGSTRRVLLYRSHSLGRPVAQLLPRTQARPRSRWSDRCRSRTCLPSLSLTGGRTRGGRMRTRGQRRSVRRDCLARSRAGLIRAAGCQR